MLRPLPPGLPAHGGARPPGGAHPPRGGLPGGARDGRPRPGPRGAGQAAAVLRGCGAGAEAPVHVVGFSKGGAVVTQLLREYADHREGGRAAAGTRAFLDRVASFVYLDSGLNVRGGAYLLDPGAAVGLALGGGGARVELHGTARQWRCRSRPWLGEEARECFHLLRGAGAPVSAEFYEMGGRGDLSAHLELLDAFRPGPQGQAGEGGARQSPSGTHTHTQ